MTSVPPQQEMDRFDDPKSKSGYAPLPASPTAEQADKAAEERTRSSRLLIYFCIMVLVGLGNKLFNKFQTVPMRNYPNFLNMWTTFIYIPCSFAYILPMIQWGSTITPEMRAIPQYKWAVMGCLDGLAGIMQVYPTTYLNGPLQILVQQSAIPISMVISKLMLKAQYKIQHYVGAGLVIAGLALTIALSSGSSDGDSSIFWVLVLAGSCIPMTLSSVFKEKALGEVEIDAVYMNGYIALYQFLLSIPLIWPAGWFVGLGWGEVWPNLINGFKCYAGGNTIMGTDYPDDCGDAPIFVNCYLVFNLGYNVLIILILKYGSANVLWMAMTTMVPMGNVFFSLPFLPTKYQKAFSISDLMGLIIIMTGLIIYRFFDNLKAMIFPQPPNPDEAKDSL